MSRSNNNDNEISSDDEFIKPTTVDETKIKDILPIELMHHVFSYLPSNDLLKIRLVCSNWKVLVDDEQIWRNLFLRTYGNCNGPLIDTVYINWKRAFKRTIYWTWNSDPVTKANEIELSNNNLTATCSKNNSTPTQNIWYTCLGTSALSAGRHYFEIMINRADPNNSIKVVFGCISSPSFLSGNIPFGYSTRDKLSWCYRGDGILMWRGLPDAVKGSSFTKDDRVGFSLDCKKKIITFFKNGVPQGRKGFGITGELYPAVSLIGDSQVTIRHTPLIPSSKMRSNSRNAFKILKQHNKGNSL